MAVKLPEGLSIAELQQAMKLPGFHKCEYFNDLSNRWVVWMLEGGKVHPWPFADYAELVAWCEGKAAQVQAANGSIVTDFAPGSAPLKAHIQANGIKSAFVFKEGEQKWQVYIGDPVTRTGLKEGEPFKTKRDALLYASKANRQIESVEQTAPLNLGVQ